MEGSALNYSNSFLLARFREFYSEVIKLKRLVREPAVDQGGGGDSDAIAVEVWQRLLSMLERHGMQAGDRSGAFGFEVFRDAQYVMAALADEIFLHFEWSGQEFWSTHLLESKIFNTHNAGELFFRKLDQLLRDRDPVYADLAAVYFLALSLGFKGKFRGQSDRRQLDFYRRETFSFIYRDNPVLLDETTYLFPKSYTYTLDERPKGRFKDLRLWVMILLITTGTWVVTQHVLWKDLATPLEQDVQRVMDLMRT